MLHRRTTPLIALFALLCNSSFSQDTPKFDAKSIHDQIQYLASDELAGRESGTAGNRAAAKFIAEHFAKAHLKPIGSKSATNLHPQGSGWYQPFSFFAGRAIGKNNQMELTIAGKKLRLRANRDFTPSGLSGQGTASGDLVYAGYGIQVLPLKHDDFAAISVKGKVVLVMEGWPGGGPHSPIAEYAGLRRKALMAREAGATALLLIPSADATSINPDPAEATDGADVGIPMVRVSRSAAKSIIEESNLSLDTLQKMADADKSVECALPISVSVTTDVKRVDKVSSNIVGVVEGSDSTLKSEYIVIGGHMDHLGMGGPFSLAKDHAKAIHHGADDNASGAIGVVQLATYFGSLPANQRPKRSLIFICFSGEELGLLGSDFYVKHPIIPLAQTPAMLNMDMIGRMVGTKLTIIGTGTATEWNPLLDNLNKSSSFEISRSENGFGGSDHQSFYNAGLPVLFFFTNLHADYHTPTDTIEKINTEGEARVLTLVANATRRIADMPSRPTFQKLKVVENSGGARGFRVYFGSIPDYAAQVEGVQLSGVREGSPAATAGLQTGDILIRFAGKSIRGVEDYSIALGENKPGDVVEVVFIRAGKKMTVKVTLAARK